MIQRDHQAINAGVFIVRNTPWAHRFLQQVYESKQYIDHYWWEQAAIINLLNRDAVREKSKVLHRGEKLHDFYLRARWDRLFLHVPAMEVDERISLLKDLSRLADNEPERRLVHRDRLGEFLNAHGLTGEGAEIGVQRGRFSRQILSTWAGKKFHLIDPWVWQEGWRDKSNVKTVKQRELMESAKCNVAPFEGRYEFHRMTSAEALDRFEDESLDFVYIDGRHDYEHASFDIRKWFRKVRVGGLVGGP